MDMNINQLKKRYSVKKFDSNRKVEPEKIELLKQAFHLCPSSLNLQGWKLFVVGDEDVKRKLAAAGRDTNGKRIEECSHLLVLARKRINFKHFERVIDNTEMLQIMIKKRGLSRAKLAIFFWFYSLTKGRNNWATNQVYIALGFLLATCASLEVGSLPMEGIVKTKMDKILGIGSEYKTVVALAVGYSHADDSTNPSLLKKSRFPMSEIVEEI